MEFELQAPQYRPSKPMATINGLDYIMIHNMSTPPSRDLNHTSIERILNHIKDNFAGGNHSLSEYFVNGGNDLFRICITYIFAYDEDNHMLKINLLSSFPEILQTRNVYDILRHSDNSCTAKTIRKNLKEKAAKQLTNNDFLIACPMSNEQQCQTLFYCTNYATTCLNRYLEFAYNESILENTTPNYYQFGVGTDAGKFL